MKYKNKYIHLNYTADSTEDKYLGFVMEKDCWRYFDCDDNLPVLKDKLEEYYKSFRKKGIIIINPNYNFAKNFKPLSGQRGEISW